MPQNRRQPRRTPNRRPQAPGQGSRAPRSGGPRRPGPATPPPRSGARAQLEKVSYPILVRLNSAPKWVLGVVTGAILLGGLLAPPPVGPALLGVVVLFLAWLLTLAWPRLQSGPRLIRLVVVIVMAALVLAQATGGLP